MTLRPPEEFVNGLGMYFLHDAKEMDKVFEVFELNAVNYPNSYNVYKSLAEAYAISNENDLAIENYRKALKLNPDLQELKDKLSELQKA